MRKAFFILSLMLLSVSSLLAQDKARSFFKNQHFPKMDSTVTWIWGDVRFHSNFDLLNPKSELRKNTRIGSKIDTIELKLSLETILGLAEDNGYPFAEIYFDSIVVSHHQFDAKVMLELHQKVVLDSLKILGPTVIHSNYLSSYLGLKPGSNYNEKRIKAISTRIEELGFIKLKFPTQVFFVNNKASIVISPEARNANKFDGLIGLQPTGTSQKTSIIGQAQLNLMNVFHRGEKMNLDFKSQANSTRDLKIYLNYPYVFSTDFGVDVNLILRRQDTSFSNFGRGIGIQYLLQGNNQIRLLYKIDESNLLSTKKYEKATQLPDNIDVKRNSYGMNIMLEQFDYRLNPKNGYGISATVLFGTRVINKNAGLQDSLYKNVQLRSNQLQLELDIKKFINLYKRNILLLSAKTKWIESDRLFNNELLRLGGINDLRGFDEESIYASYYWTATLEYRYSIDRNSFFRAFFDQGYFYNKISATSDYPYGVGVGVQVQTVAGMLQLNYALGAQNNSGLNFQTGKIHFGIINYF
jgi:outer membrane protein assembly factor BamA